MIDRDHSWIGTAVPSLVGSTAVSSLSSGGPEPQG